MTRGDKIELPTTQAAAAAWPPPATIPTDMAAIDAYELLLPFTAWDSKAITARWHTTYR